MRKCIWVLIAILVSSVSWGKEPLVGREAAQKYFDKEPRTTTFSEGDSLLMLHVGGYVNSQSYLWKGSEKREGVAKATYGITYLVDQWSGFDVDIRADFTEYVLDEVRPTKLSVMPLFTFPKAESRFPLYFGFGAGLGIFFTQVEGESNLSMDYQLIAGKRFINLMGNFGLFAEYGLKNHLHVLSDGQLNGTFLSGGAVFSF
jgi:hypothetical protein